MENNSICPHCGASMKIWKHSLTAGLVAVLIKAIDAVKKTNKNSFNLQDDLLLSVSENNNFQKLQYFGLIAHDKTPGKWLITTLGGQFLRNEVGVQKFALSFRDRLIEREGPVIKISSFYEHIYGEDYWQKRFEPELLSSKLL